jgi:hypothetical protein
LKVVAGKYAGTATISGLRYEYDPRSAAWFSATLGISGEWTNYQTLHSPALVKAFSSMDANFTPDDDRIQIALIGADDSNSWFGWMVDGTLLGTVHATFGDSGHVDCKITRRH